MAAAKKPDVSARKLASFVHVNGTAYGPDSDVPADVAALITNPAAWAPDAGPATVDAGEEA